MIVVVEGGLDWLLPHPVTPAVNATDKATRSRPPRRRRRGSTSRSRPARVMPEPAVVQGWLENGLRPGFCCANSVPELELPGTLGRCRLAVMPERVRVVVTGAVELMVADTGLKLRVGM